MRKFSISLIVAALAVFALASVAQAFSLPILAAGVKPNGNVQSAPGDFSARPFHLRDGKVTQDLSVILVLTDPVSGDELARHTMTIADADLEPFGNESASANGFLWGARSGLKASLSHADVAMADGRIESADVWTDDGGVVKSVQVFVNVSVQLVAAPGSTLLELATIGSNVPDGTVLFSERVRISVEGLDYTNLDPAIVSFATLVQDIEAGVLAAFN